jgi:hypothetical protein
VRGSRGAHGLEDILVELNGTYLIICRR